MPLAEQRKICNGILYELENNTQPDIESTVVELEIPIEEFMSRNGAVHLSDFEKKLLYQEKLTKNGL